MVEIQICVGGSCHLNGSFDVVQKLEQLATLHKLTDYIVLKACSCMSNCLNGVCVQIGDEKFENINAKNIENLFETEVMKRIIP